MTPTLMLWMVLFPMVVAPACAVVAGGITWTITRQEPMEDGTLLRHFLVILAMLLLGSYGVVSADFVKERLDPSIRMRRELMQAPVLAALRENFAHEWEDKTSPLIDRGLAAGMNVAQVRSLLWPAQVNEARRLLAFSSPPAATAYAQGLLPALQELERSDLQLCAELVWPQASARPFDPSARLSPSALAGYEAGLVVLLGNNSLSTSDQRAKADRNWNSFSQDEQRAAWDRIAQPIAARDGAVLARLRAGEVAALDPQLACSIGIEAVERALQEPPGLSDLMLIRLLRS